MAATRRGGANDGRAGVESDLVLLRRYAADPSPALREEIVERFMPLARSLAMRYRRQTESLDDLIQVAGLGLVKASTASTPSAASRSPRTPSRRSSASCAATSATTSGPSACRAGCRSSR